MNTLNGKSHGHIVRTYNSLEKVKRCDYLDFATLYLDGGHCHI